MKIAKFALATAVLSAVATGVKVANDEVHIDAYEMPTECEEKSKKGDYLDMHYTGTIDKDSPTGKPGRKFDSSRDRGDPFNFQLGAGAVIKGWDEGLLDMCVGEKRRLTIGPDKGYGSRGAGEDIPGGAVLHFDVELMAISDEPGKVPNFFKIIDADQNGVIDRDEVIAYFKKHAQDGGEEPSADEIKRVMETEDADKDGQISWEEFSGPKGKEPPPKQEL